MKRTHLLLLLALSLGTLGALPHRAWTRQATAAPTAARSFTISRQPGTFEIHIFDVEQGDSQLVIFPSGYSILIDVSESSWNTGKGAALIAEKIRTLTGGDHVDVAVLTHLHLDHIGYAGYGGFWALLEREGITFGQIIDRDAGQWVDGSGGGAADGACDPEREIEWHNAGTVSNTARRWLCYATHPANAAIYAAREVAQVGSITQIDPPDANATVEVIEVDAQGVMMADGVTPVSGDHTTAPLPPSENDYSIALKISYGEIDYATAGDTDGEYATSQWGYLYNDVESVIASRFGQVELLHVNHHGSSHSSNGIYVAILDPEVSLISCGRNTYGHPDQTVLDRLLATSQVYLTNVCDETRDYGPSIIADGDIVIRSQDGLIYEVLVPRRAFLPLVLD
jgi:beta-lactamase superfamily II metal-dependent hydrolase